MPNITIKEVGDGPDGSPLHATTKVFLRATRVYPPLRPGEVVEVSDEEAKFLLGGPLKRVIEITLDEPNREEPPRFGVTDEDADKVAEKDRLPLIRSAIRRMDREDKSLWTESGRPLVSAIEGLLMFDITAKERNEAWKAVKGEFVDSGPAKGE